MVTVGDHPRSVRDDRAAEVSRRSHNPPQRQRPERPELDVVRVASHKVHGIELQEKSSVS